MYRVVAFGAVVVYWFCTLMLLFDHPVFVLVVAADIRDR